MMANSTLPSVNLNRWRPHVLAALQAQQSFAAYAREHQLSRHSLYVAHRHLKAAGEVAAQHPPQASADTGGTPRPFVPVSLAVATRPLAVVAQLPNGVCLHCDGEDAAALYGLLRQLAALPCSA